MHRTFMDIFFAGSKFFTTFAPAIKHGTLAQVVEQWTENPCVLGSTPRGTTPPFIRAVLLLQEGRLFYFYIITLNYP